MNINASIIDQRVVGIAEEYSDCLPQTSDINQKKAAAFVLLCMSTSLEMPLEESAEHITEGGNDAGVDGIHIGEVEDGEFLVTIFQCKYKIMDLSGKSNFPENGVQKAVNTVQVLFDPSRNVTLNPKIAPKIEEIRSLIRDAFIPTVRVMLCNNGDSWNEQAESWITQAKKDYADKVSFIHFNHDSMINILQRSKRVDATLAMSGQAIVEDMNYMRVLIGRVSVQEIYRLFNEHGNTMLERNIRRYLGLHTNRVNSAIHETLVNPDKSDKFYFFNNGITVVCDKFDYNAFQQTDFKVQLKNMQIINGGQTCKTIQETLDNNMFGTAGKSAYVMIRIYQLSDTYNEIVQEITYATNSQNPVDLRDLRSNDETQKLLALGMSELGYTYKSQREVGTSTTDIIPSTSVAESVMAIWRQKPHQAKFLRREHFGKLYGEIFNDLNASQAVLAVLIFRFADKVRKRPNIALKTDFLAYSTHYIAMLIGRNLINELNLRFEEITHRNFKMIQSKFVENQEQLHQQALQEIDQALKACYGNRKISLQQLSATFRRGDLLEMLDVDD